MLNATDPPHSHGRKQTYQDPVASAPLRTRCRGKAPCSGETLSCRRKSHSGCSQAARFATLTRARFVYASCFHRCTPSDSCLDARPIFAVLPDKR